MALIHLKKYTESEEAVSPPPLSPVYATALSAFLYQLFALFDFTNRKLHFIMKAGPP